jgi:hypothetical protein
MLHDFVTSNRQALIEHCRANVAKRFAPAAVPAELAYGVPVFLQQLAEVLRCEQRTGAREAADAVGLPGSTAIGRSAALHGAELLRLGFTIDQVVHDYGDVCQSITELAIKKHADISVDEFRTLNRCLDNAIADSVRAFEQPPPVEVSKSEPLHAVLGEFYTEQTRLIQIVAQSFAAIKTGNIGLSGATGALLEHALEQLRLLTERTLPEIRRSAA